MFSVSWPLLVSAVGILIAILFALFIYLIGRKIIAQRRLERKEVLKDKVRPIIFRYLNSGEDGQTRLIQEGALFVYLIEEILSDFQDLMKGDEVKDRISKFAETYLGDVYKKRLFHRRWSLRMNTLFFIEDFHMTALESDLWSKYNKGIHNRDELYQTARTLAALHSTDFSHYLLKNKTEFPSFLYKELFRRFSEDFFEKTVENFQNHSFKMRIAIIEFIGEQKLWNYYYFIEQLLESDEKELRISALKVIYMAGFLSNPEKLDSFSTSNYWQEKLFFAKVCSRIKKERFKSDLTVLISDSNWFVRDAAGEALASYSDGNWILQHIIEMTEDVFARDMAKQWMERRGE